MKTKKRKTQVLKRGYTKLKPNHSKRTAAHVRRKTAHRIVRSRRPLHRKLFLHPTTMFVILCAGVLMCSWTYEVVASTIISSVIEAPPLQSAATITSPMDRAVITSLPTDVSGSCPTNSYIVLQLNGTFDGVAWCGQDNTYSIATSLYDGANRLSVQAYNQTDVAGPTSPSIQVNYRSSSVAPTSTSSATSTNARAPVTAATAKPILLSSNFEFKTFDAQKVFTWQVDITGGTPPYNVHVSWGDGSSSDLYFATDQLFTLKHTFKNPGYYAVVLSARDATGQTKVIQLAALINDTDGKSSFITSVAPKTNNPNASNSFIARETERWLIVAWPSYLIILLMTLSFWLGEKREYLQILHATRYKHRMVRR